MSVVPQHGRPSPRRNARLVSTLPIALSVLLAAAVSADRTDPGPGHRHLHPEYVAAATTTPLPLPRTAWTVTADSAAQAAGRAIDGDAATSWRSAGTAWPHTFVIDMHNRFAVGGLTYLPSPAAADGRIGRYAVEVSDDGATWRAPVATGTFADDGGQKTVTFPAVVTRHVRLSALSEAGNRATAVAAAEINLLGGTDPALPRAGWTVAADSQETVAENGLAANVLDGDTTTMWHTRWSSDPDDPLPHTLTVDMHATALVSGLEYLPRQRTGGNGRIGRYRIETSTDGSTWGAPVTAGQFTDTANVQAAAFTPVLARYVRLTALSEAGARGPWSSAAEINLLGRPDPTLPRTGWTASASSQESVHPAARALDGDPATFWHSRWSSDPDDPLPHTLTLTLPAATDVGGLTYLPRAATSANGRIGRYRIEVSSDGSGWTAVATDRAFTDDAALKTVVFPPRTARHVRLVALSEAGGRGSWSSAAEVNLLGPSGAVAPAQGSWGVPVGFPLVPVAAAVLPSGKILTWSAYRVDDFGGGTGRTITATYDPATRVVTQRTVTETRHDMFCPGISMLKDGRILVTGGNDSAATSIYNPATDAWTTGPKMTTPRGYQASVTLSDNRVFAIGGSWSGGIGGRDGTPRKNGEVWSATTGWKALPAASVIPMLTADADPNGDYRKDNHGWLFAWTGGTVFQAGPSRAMNWYTTSGTGGVTPAGPRGDDTDAMNGTAVMYDAGKILTMGGSPSYTRSAATANAYVITLGAGTAGVRKVAPMVHARSFANSVVLPDGKVAVFGGQNFPVPFSDNTAVLAPEIWDPVIERFTTMASAAVPRTYHSVAVLMPDARVFTGGGGLCGGCTTNHFDGEIFTPPYLLNPDGTAAPRPAISAAPATAAHGASITVTTDRPVTRFAVVRMGSATHSVNTDQRRIELSPTPVTGGYRLTIPADPGVAVPGYYMLFALDAKGVPSVAKTLRIG